MSLGPLGTNCYIVYNDYDAIIVDPGGDSGKISTFLNENKITPTAILLTHAHFDHIGGVEELRSYFNIDVYIHQKEADWLEDPQLNGSSLFLGYEIAVSRAEHLLTPGNKEINSIGFEVIHTPGHSPGSVSFIFHDHDFTVSGDVLFRRGIGRTDLPGGDIRQLEVSIKDSLYTLPGTYKVYPGHGPETSIEEEKRENPFFSM